MPGNAHVGSLNVAHMVCLCRQERQPCDVGCGLTAEKAGQTSTSQLVDGVSKDWR
jgi:hypothetical protein